MTVEIGSKYSPEHAVHRQNGEYWERSMPAWSMSADEVRLQRGILKRPVMRTADYFAPECDTRGGDTEVME